MVELRRLSAAFARNLALKFYNIQLPTAFKLENKNVYRYFQLPLNVKQIAMTIAVEFFKDRNTQVEWPGGRRAKLPSMTNSN